MPNLCRHILTTGLQCQAFALTGERFCYFHNNLNKRHRYFRPNQVTDPGFVYGKHIRLTSVEDRESLLMAISQTIGAIATGQIELRAGTAILYGLQLALLSLKDIQANPQPAPPPEAIVSTVVRSADHLDLAPAAPEPTTIEASLSRT